MEIESKMANLNLANDSHKEFLSNKNKNHNCFSYNYNSNTPTNTNNQNVNNDSKKSTQEIYRSFLEAQVGKFNLTSFLFRLKKKIIRKA